MSGRSPKKRQKPRPQQRPRPQQPTQRYLPPPSGEVERLDIHADDAPPGFKLGGFTVLFDDGDEDALVIRHWVSADMPLPPVSVTAAMLTESGLSEPEDASPAAVGEDDYVDKMTIKGDEFL